MRTCFVLDARTIRAGPSWNAAMRIIDRTNVVAFAVLVASAVALSDVGAQAPSAGAPVQAVQLPPPVASQPTQQSSPGSALAPASDYRIGTHDLLEIQIFGIDTLNRSVRVNAKGMVSLPLVGPVEVGGKTAQEAEEHLSAKLAEKYLQNPQVSLFIKEFTSQRVTVEGAVKRPGIYPLAGQTTLLRALALAGGQDALADLSEVMVFRVDPQSGKRQQASFDIDRIRKGEVDDPTLANDDLIVVNRSRTRVQLKDSVFRDVLDFINPFAR
jgi:polysaccharide biosynthesis/export protein